jgi:hypothetical protein
METFLFVRHHSKKSLKLTLIFSVHGCELQLAVGGMEWRRIWAVKKEREGRILVVGAENHGLIRHGKRLIERAGGQ